MKRLLILSTLALFIAGCSRGTCVCEMYDAEWNYVGHLEGQYSDGGGCTNVNVETLFALPDDGSYDTVVCMDDIQLS